MGDIKVMVVEDDKSLLALYDLALPDERFEKKLVGNGTDALATYLSWKPDVIVLDILLPERSGYMVLEEIREKWKDNRTKVIISSCLDYKTSISDCKRLGIQGYIVKPFDHKTLADRVTRIHAGEEFQD